MRSSSFRLTLSRENCLLLFLRLFRLHNQTIETVSFTTLPKLFQFLSWSRQPPDQSDFNDAKQTDKLTDGRPSKVPSSSFTAAPNWRALAFNWPSICPFSSLTTAWKSSVESNQKHFDEKVRRSLTASWLPICFHQSRFGFAKLLSVRLVLATRRRLNYRTLWCIRNVKMYCLYFFFLTQFSIGYSRLFSLLHRQLISLTFHVCICACKTCFLVHEKREDLSSYFSILVLLCLTAPVGDRRTTFFSYVDRNWSATQLSSFSSFTFYLPGATDVLAVVVLIDIN